MNRTVDGINYNQPIRIPSYFQQSLQWVDEALGTTEDLFDAIQNIIQGNLGNMTCCFCFAISATLAITSIAVGVGVGAGVGCS
ncbi:hypothetical protein I4U23_023066 [Adineta vaga]|nr:hypothetical protein I4U23_023066 [Adineta vaga]